MVKKKFFFSYAYYRTITVHLSLRDDNCLSRDNSVENVGKRVDT